MALGISTTSSAVAAGLGSLGGRKVWIGSVTFDSSYPTGGYSFSPSLFGMAQVETVLGSLLSSGNAMVRYTAAAGATGKMQVVVATTGAEQANASNLSGLSAQVVVVGI